MGMTSDNWDNGSLSATDENDKWERLNLGIPITALLRSGKRMAVDELGYVLTKDAEDTFMEEYFYVPSKNNQDEFTKTFRYALGLAFCNFLLQIDDEYVDLRPEDAIIWFLWTVSSKVAKLQSLKGYNDIELAKEIAKVVTGIYERSVIIHGKVHAFFRKMHKLEESEETRSQQRQIRKYLRNRKNDDLHKVQRKKRENKENRRNKTKSEIESSKGAVNGNKHVHFEKASDTSPEKEKEGRGARNAGSMGRRRRERKGRRGGTQDVTEK
eukprot:926405-Rhodomonas_salina.1